MFRLEVMDPRAWPQDADEVAGGSQLEGSHATHGPSECFHSLIPVWLLTKHGSGDAEQVCTCLARPVRLSTSSFFFYKCHRV